MTSPSDFPSGFNLDPALHSSPTSRRTHPVSGMCHHPFVLRSPTEALFGSLLLVRVSGQFRQGSLEEALSRMPIGDTKVWLMVPFENPAPQMLKTFLFKMTECVWLQTMRFGLLSFQLSK